MSNDNELLLKSNFPNPGNLHAILSVAGVYNEILNRKKLIILDYSLHIQSIVTDQFLTA